VTARRNVRGAPSVRNRHRDASRASEHGGELQRVDVAAVSPVRVPDLASDRARDRLAKLIDPLTWITRPKLYGVERIPTGGVLLVGNHTIYGLLDVPFMMATLWRDHRIAVRALGDHLHYAFPLWRELLELGGMVRGTRENVRALMSARQNVLVFPGGAREVAKRRHERYRLIWKERLGFARLAIEWGYPIVPFAAVGAEEMLDVVVDENSPIYGQLIGLLHKMHVPSPPPIVRGIGPTPIPRPERLYFLFGEAIDTSCYTGRHEDDRAARAVRDEVRGAVEQGIDFLRGEREKDPDWRLTRRLLVRHER